MQRPERGGSDPWETGIFATAAIYQMHKRPCAGVTLQDPGIAPNDPVCGVLDDFLGERRRIRFLELLSRTGVVAEVIDTARPKGEKE